MLDASRLSDTWGPQRPHEEEDTGGASLQTVTYTHALSKARISQNVGMWPRVTYPSYARVTLALISNNLFLNNPSL